MFDFHDKTDEFGVDPAISKSMLDIDSDDYGDIMPQDIDSSANMNVDSSFIHDSVQGFSEISDNNIGAGHNFGPDSPYFSGFDDEHPIPTYDELRNAGFTEFEAKQIIYGHHDSYSNKELFECLYGSDDPKAAYDAMMQRKADELSEKIDRFIYGELL